MSQPQHTYTLRQEVGFGVELALSQLGEPHEIQIENFKGNVFAVRITDDPLASLRATSLWETFDVNAGQLTTVPAGTRKLAVENVEIGGGATTVFHLPGFFRGAESGRYYGVDQLTLPYPAGVAPLIWYDFTDASVMFQDLARTIPVTEDGQTVEAVSDKGTFGAHLDEPRIVVPTVGKPTYQTVATGGRSALDFDRGTGLTNEGQMIRTSRSDVAIPIGAMLLVVGNWQEPPGVGGSGLCVGSVTDSVFGQSPGSSGVRITCDDNDQQQANGVDGDFAGWLHDFASGDEGRCSINGLAGVAGSNAENFTEFKTAGFLGVGGNQNGGAAGSAWNGTISEIVIWAGDLLPTEQGMERYATSRYALNWL